MLLHIKNITIYHWSNLLSQEVETIHGDYIKLDTALQIREPYLKSCRNPGKKVSMPAWGGGWSGIRPGV